jgi:putative aminopeptidase FrvX
MSLEQRVEKYCLTMATSGREEPMIQAMKEDFSAYTDAITVDSFGNVMAHFEASSPTDNTLMVFAHTDQLGMVVTKVEPSGFIRVVRLGGVPERVLPGSVVKIVTGDGGTVTGVMGTPPHHLTPESMKYQVPTIDRAYIDIGATSAAEVRALGIDVGAHVAYEPRFEKLQNERVTGTSIDDRGGCAVLVGVAEHLAAHPAPVNVVLVATVQEEFNLRGAMLAAEKIKPVAAISIDLVAAGDTPEMGTPNGVEVGGGPVMGLYSFHGRGTLNGVIPHPGLVKMVEETSAQHKLPLQRHATVGLLTDASYVQLVNGGTPAIDLCWPTRYTHTGVEMCSLGDLEKLQQLVTELVAQFPNNWDNSRTSE